MHRNYSNLVGGAAGNAAEKLRRENREIAQKKWDEAELACNQVREAEAARKKTRAAEIAERAEADKDCQG